MFSFIFRGALQDLVLERSGRVEFRVSRVYSNLLLKPSSTNLQAPDGSLHFVLALARGVSSARRRLGGCGYRRVFIIPPHRATADGQIDTESRHPWFTPSPGRVSCHTARASPSKAPRSQHPIPNHKKPLAWLRSMALLLDSALSPGSHHFTVGTTSELRERGRRASQGHGSSPSTPTQNSPHAPRRRSSRRARTLSDWRAGETRRGIP